MADPHVTTLYYNLSHADNVDFSEAKPLEYKTDEFQVRIAGGKAVFTLLTHHSDPASARTVVDEFTRAWEVRSHLVEDCSIAFEYDHADMIDRAEPGDTAMFVDSGSYEIAGHAARLVYGRKTYPEPPSDFAISTMLN